VDECDSCEGLVEIYGRAVPCRWCAPERWAKGGEPMSNRPACACGRPLYGRPPRDPVMAKKCGFCRAQANDPLLKRMRPAPAPAAVKPLDLGACSFAGCRCAASETDGDGEAWCHEHGRAVIAPTPTPVPPKSKDAGALLLVRRALDLVELAGGIEALDALVREHRGLRRGA